MRFLENVIAAVALLAINNSTVAQRMPTPQEIARQQDAFASALSQVPAHPAQSERLAGRLASGSFVANKVDPSEVAKRYANAQKKAVSTGTDLMIFVSFSMPKTVIAELSKQAKQYGATMVMRGFAGDSMTKTGEIAQQANPGGATWQINPDAFKTFKVQSVPAIVLASAGAASILEEGCARPGSYVSLSGNQSLDVALQTIRRSSKIQSLAADADLRLRKGNGTISR